MDQMPREGFPYPPSSRAYVFAKEICRNDFFWMLILRGASGNLQFAIRATWQGKAFHIRFIEGLIFMQGKFSDLIFLDANFQERLWKPIVCHKGPMVREGFPCPLYSRAYVLQRKFSRRYCFWLLVFRGASGNLQFAIWAN